MQSAPQRAVSAVCSLVSVSQVLGLYRAFGCELLQNANGKDPYYREGSDSDDNCTNAVFTQSTKLASCKTLASQYKPHNRATGVRTDCQDVVRESLHSPTITCCGASSEITLLGALFF